VTASFFVNKCTALEILADVAYRNVDLCELLQLPLLCCWSLGLLSALLLNVSLLSILLTGHTDVLTCTHAAAAAAAAAEQQQQQQQQQQNSSSSSSANQQQQQQQSSGDEVVGISKSDSEA
jgi:hypothetical protein